MKKWYLSKTLWVNFLAFVGLALQVYYGKEVFSSDQQAMVLAAVNIVLRWLTFEQVN